MIYIGSDHRGFKAKADLKKYFTKHHVEFKDLGALTLSPNDDFNAAAIKVAKAVCQDPYHRGILICGSAHGMVMQANRFFGIRAISATEEKLIKLGREHNDANVLCLSADFLSNKKMHKFIEIFLNTNFKNDEKYIRRINRLDDKENYA